MKDDQEHDHKSGHDHGKAIFGEKTELIFSLICGVFLIIGYLLGKFADVASAIPLVCYSLAYIFGGWFALKEAFESLKSRKFQIDLLMLVAAIGAAVLGEWAEGALLLFLFSLGHSLEHYAMGRARRAIEALSELSPDFALVRRDGDTVELPVEDLQPGDIAIIKPDERIPADGFVVKGQSSVFR